MLKQVFMVFLGLNGFTSNVDTVTFVRETAKRSHYQLLGSLDVNKKNKSKTMIRNALRHEKAAFRSVLCFDAVVCLTAVANEGENTAFTKLYENTIEKLNKKIRKELSFHLSTRMMCVLLLMGLKTDINAE